jgi:hypothetical protein
VRALTPVLVDTVSGAPETAPIAPPLCRPRPPARLRRPPAPSGMAPSLRPPFRSSAVSSRFYRPGHLPSIYITPLALPSTYRRTFPSFPLSFPLCPFLSRPYRLLRISFQPDALPLSFYRRYRAIRLPSRSNHRRL